MGVQNWVEFDQTWKYVKLESIRTLLKIIHLEYNIWPFISKVMEFLWEINLLIKKVDICGYGGGGGGILINSFSPTYFSAIISAR